MEKLVNSKATVVKNAVQKSDIKILLVDDREDNLFSIEAIFEKDNYLWMLGGIVIMAIGLFLMAGGKSNDPNQFHPEEVYSTRRITIAPILILAGLVLEIFAIFRKPKG